MKFKSPWRCDFCPNIKGDNNHWFLFLPNWNVEAANSQEHIEFTINALFSRWNDVTADMDGVQHICSESCADKALSKWMAEQNVRSRLDPDVAEVLP